MVSLLDDLVDLMGCLGAGRASLSMKARLFQLYRKCTKSTESYWTINYCDHEQAHLYKW